MSFSEWASPASHQFACGSVPPAFWPILAFHHFFPFSFHFRNLHLDSCAESLRRARSASSDPACTFAGSHMAALQQTSFQSKSTRVAPSPPQPYRFSLMFPCQLYNEELWDEVTYLAGMASLLSRIHPSSCHYCCYCCCHVCRREKSLSVSVPAPESPSVLWLLVHIFAQRVE